MSRRLFPGDRSSIFPAALDGTALSIFFLERVWGHEPVDPRPNRHMPLELKKEEI